MVLFWWAINHVVCFFGEMKSSTIQWKQMQIKSETMPIAANHFFFHSFQRVVNKWIGRSAVDMQIDGCVYNTHLYGVCVCVFFSAWSTTAYTSQLQSFCVRCVCLFILFFGIFSVRAVNYISFDYQFGFCDVYWKWEFTYNGHFFEEYKYVPYLI